MFTGLFSSDKAPFILTLTLAILSWFVSNIVSNIADVTVIGIRAVSRGQMTTYEIANHSLKESITSAYFKFNCHSNGCFRPLVEGEAENFVNARYIPPYAVQGISICKQDSGGISAVFSLPPGATIAFDARLEKRGNAEVVFAGLAPTGGNVSDCPDSETRLAPANVWIYSGCSITLFLIKYYFQILVTLLVVTLGFLVFLLLRPAVPPPAGPAPVGTKPTQ